MLVGMILFMAVMVLVRMTVVGAVSVIGLVVRLADPSRPVSRATAGGTHLQITSTS
jgi:hypothetical protein